MFKNAQPLDKIKHAHLRFTPVSDMRSSRDMTTAPLMLSEVPASALCFPVLFAPDGVARPMAVLGFIDRNTFLDEQDQWTVSYIPAHILRHPFILGKSREEGNFLIMIDVDAPQFASEDGAPLFTEEGEPSAHTQANIRFLGEFEKNMQQDQILLAELEQAGVLTANNLTIKDGDSTRLIGGFRIVDQEKVNALDDATLARWARSGLLGIIHAHWLSMKHLNKVAVNSSRLKQAD